MIKPLFNLWIMQQSCVFDACDTFKQKVSFVRLIAV